ncbi:MAG: deoxyuridine 5'-triphosphate nucleotidohydrolase [Bacteroidetes bacterium GWF2_33_16]|nr:MAG: deoxyuridine 5'-triphosphate nucleotidohydrolase [Bacteroidetes bacterium GWE2_32_14]OFY03438.1 MAG: deoxyuridine 5'-triphosphate nucleotidohydrolase [Bacteroidetes bacterium GWF2_33_16]
MEVKIINKSNNPLPEYGTEHAAGMDLRSFLASPVTLKPLERLLIPTGLFIELPIGYEAQIRPRSGLALKKGLTVLNTPGTIDADYRGEIGVILINLSNMDVIIESGERICQMVISKHEHVLLNDVNDLSQTERGARGFGSTGTK